METFCTNARKHAEKLLIFSETTWNLLSFQVVTKGSVVEQVGSVKLF
jgi:hypothetical protein